MHQRPSNGSLQSPTGIKIDRRIFWTSETLHVPHLLDIEVAQVLRRYVRDKTTAAQRGEEALEDLDDMPLEALSTRFLKPARLGTACNPNCLRCGIRRACRGARCASADLRRQDCFRFGSLRKRRGRLACYLVMLAVTNQNLLFFQPTNPTHTTSCLVRFSRVLAVPRF